MPRLNVDPLFAQWPAANALQRSRTCCTHSMNCVYRYPSTKGHGTRGQMGEAQVGNMT